MSKIAELTTGKKYRVVYRAPGQRRDREFIGVYLSTTRDGDEVYFSLRPDFGTQTLSVDWLRSAVEVPAAERSRITKR